jgi:hypothetical protein
MDSSINAFAKGFLTSFYGGVTLGLLLTGCIVHVLLTPMKEMQLIRQGMSRPA